MNSGCLLELRGLSKSFGGLVAVNNADLQVEKGEIRAIIGPNGAGKSTLIGLISGGLRPDVGRVLFQGQDITGLSPFEVRRMGIARSFQKTNIFPHKSVFENARLAIQSLHPKAAYSLCNVKTFKELSREANMLLDELGLGNERWDIAGRLSYGKQRLIEIALALAGSPSLILLDEPVAGLSPVESMTVAKMIEKIARKRGNTIIFIEHDMQVVFSVADRISVLHYGQVVTEGSPSEVKASQLVQEIYLGKEGL